jgi:hypothetical protein
MLHILQVFRRHVASVLEVLFKIFRLFHSRRTLQAFRFRCCTYFTHMLQQNIFQIFQPFSVLRCSTCFHVRKLQVFYLVLHMFHIHVASVCSKCFIRFIQMLHSSVSRCLESRDVRGRDGGTTWAQGNGPRKARGQWTGCAARRCPADEEHLGPLVGCDGGGVRVRDGTNSLESRQTGARCTDIQMQASHLDVSDANSPRIYASRKAMN